MKPQLAPSPLHESLAELENNGFCVLRSHYSEPLVEAARDAFAPILADYLQVNRDNPNRGPHRHFVPMPFDPPCFTPEFFFARDVVQIVQQVMDEKVVADQWGCDTAVLGSTYQDVHVDYRNPLFPELPDMKLPFYMVVLSFGLIDITPAHGPIEIAAGTHRMPREQAMRALERGEIPLEPVLLNMGDVLLRHPWALHRGTPNRTDTPRPLVTIRYVRRWYWDASRDVNAIPRAVWESLTPDQQRAMRFPVANKN